MYEYNQIYHKGKMVRTTVGLPSYEAAVVALTNNPSTQEGYIPAGYEHRPDLIADLFFDSASAWNLVMEMNGIFDPFESLKVGDRINIPNA
jgi:hypothetical protein